MRKSTIALASVLAVLALCAALFLLGGTLRAELTATSVPASEAPEAFAALGERLSSGKAAQVFQAPLPADPAACRLEDVNITLRNPGLFPAEWVSVAALGGAGDVAVYAVAGEGRDIPARGAGGVNLKLAALADATEERTYVVTYYVFGMKRTVSVSQGARQAS